MNEGFVPLYIFLGILLRFAVPLGITFLVARFLRNLDRKWREEAKLEQDQSRLVFANLFQQKPCWEYNHCSGVLKAECMAFGQKLPCWEVYRSNGSLRTACKTCKYRQQIIMVPAGI